MPRIFLIIRRDCCVQRVMRENEERVTTDEKLQRPLRHVDDAQLASFGRINEYLSVREIHAA